MLTHETSITDQRDVSRWPKWRQSLTHETSVADPPDVSRWLSEKPLLFYLFFIIFNTVIHFNLNYCFKMTIIVTWWLVDWFGDLYSVFSRAALLLLREREAYLTTPLIDNWSMHWVGVYHILIFTDDSLVGSCYCRFIIVLLGTDGFGVANQTVAPRNFRRTSRNNSTIGRSNCLKHLTAEVNCRTIRQLSTTVYSTTGLTINSTTVNCGLHNWVNRQLDNHQLSTPQLSWRSTRQPFTIYSTTENYCSFYKCAY